MAVCGKLDLDKNEIKTLGIDAVLEVKNDSISVAYSMENAFEIIEKLVEDFLREKLMKPKMIFV